MDISKKLMFVTEARFFKDKDNNFYTEKSFDSSIWDRYLSYFDEINVIARVKDISLSQTDELIKNSNERVQFSPLPYFIGLKQLFLQRNNLIQALDNILQNASDYKVILRVPGTIGYYCARYLRKHSLKYNVEVVGDPDEVFAKANFKHPLRPLLRFKAVNNLKYVLQGASAVLFVTKTTLQNKYLLKKSQFSFGVSDVNISDDLVASTPKKHSIKNKYKIISVGSLAQMYKSPDIVIKAVKLINNSQKDFQIELVWLGDGVYKNAMIDLSKQLEVENDVSFRGNVSREVVLDSMRGSDLFVLASRTEGLPRVVIEAMAMGLPVVATNVGGIPELLEKKVLVEKDNINSLVEKILEIITDGKFYNVQSARNLSESEQYKSSYLNSKRNEFFDKLSKT